MKTKAVNPAVFARSVRILRGLAELTQEEFARRLGVRPLQVLRWEKGRCLPHPKMLRRIVRAIERSAAFQRHAG
ncbi:MAG: helix-turn-helix transcriptional regulator [Candidatus Rokuibacteriota bacterium]